MLDHSSSVPLHDQAEQWVLGYIMKAKEGDLLPDEVALSKRLGISRNTLRVALDRLVREGLLERRRGVGTRILSAQTATGLGEWESFTREMKARGHQVENYRLNVEKVTANETVANALGVPPQTEILHLLRVRGYDDSPVAVFESWFHPCLDLPLDADFSRPLYDVIAAHCDWVPMRSREEISAKPASQNIANLLIVDAGFPLLIRSRIVTDAGGRVLEYALNHYRGDRMSYTVDLWRKS